MKRASLFLPLLIGGCYGVQSPLNPAGAQAGSVLLLFAVMLVVCGTMYLIVLAVLAWAILRRNPRGNDSEPNQVPVAERRLSRGLVAWLIIVLVGLTVLIVASFLVERDLASVRARETLIVRVTGHQWWWRIEYRDPLSGTWVETADELHLPAGRTARIELGSADVIHSFWVPNVAGKMDVIPGRANSVDVTPRKAGWFRGQCAEFCGLQHAHMAFDVKVERPAEFAMWLTAQKRGALAPSDAAVARGMQVVVGGQCAMCHVIRGTTANGRAGPDLTHIGSRRSIAAGTLSMSRGALQGWIAQPQAIKPGTMMPPVPLTPADADAAARYLEFLK